MTTGLEALLDAPFEGDLDASHHMFRAACARFVRDEVAPHAHAWEEAEALPPDLWRRAADAGLLGPAFPQALGGGGGDVLHLVVSTEALVRGGSVGVAAGLGSLEIALPPVLHLGTPAQQAALVPPVLRGERVAALCVTEPGAGSDVAGVRTTARRAGDGWALSGSKLFVTSGVRADLLVVLARTGPDPHAGLSFFAVDKATPGVTVSRALQKTGWRASDTAELAFEDARLPADALLGPEGAAFGCLMQTFVRERLLLAAQGHAIAQVCLEDALAHARRREAFGRPIVGFQVVRHKLADMATRTLAAKGAVYRAAARLRDGACSPAEAAAVKNLAGDVAREVSHEAVQVLGGMGYMRETRAERLSRDARLLSIGGGTREGMNEVIARALVDA